MQPIAIVRGTTRYIGVSVFDEDGEPYTLQSGEYLRFGIKKKPSDTSFLVQKQTNTANSDGAYVFTLVPDDTKSLPFGRYYYDVGLKSGTNYYNVIECSFFDIAFNVTNVDMVIQ